jgi:hypothetical protein
LELNPDSASRSSIFLRSILLDGSPRSCAKANHVRSFFHSTPSTASVRSEVSVWSSEKAEESELPEARIDFEEESSQWQATSI